jgi:RHS repeat-associated protein
MKGNSLSVRLTSALLAFLFILAPIFPVLAQEAADNSAAPASAEVATAGNSTESADTSISAETSANTDSTGTVNADAGKAKNDPLVSANSKPEVSMDPLISPETGKGKNGTDSTTGIQPMTATSESSAPNNSLNISSSQKQIILNPNNINGPLSYDYPIVVLPGRSGLQPDLSLSYNSQSTEDGAIFGAGWSIIIPYIERINKNGTNNLYSQTYFNSSLSGELVSLGGTSYGSKVDNGEFLQYTFSNNSWAVKDKQGTQYKFGYSSATRLDNPNDSSKIFRWMLEEVRDTNNNYITYQYYKDAGQIYPSKIIYTGNGSTNGIFEVNFLRESRSDTYLSYKTGFGVQSNYRIYEINTTVNGSWVHKYTLSYAAGDNGRRSLLASITESGRDESGVASTLPPTQFTYQRSTISWTRTVISNPPLKTYDYSYGSPVNTGHVRAGIANINHSLTDLNGDSIPDFIESFAWNYDSSTGLFQQAYNDVYTNNGINNWVLNSGLEPLYQVAGQDGRAWLGDNFNQGVQFDDVNGDLLPDTIKSQDGTNGAHAVYLNNTGTSWTQSAAWVPAIGFTDSVDIQNGGTSGDYGTRALDLNGDGLIDIARKQESNQNYGAQLNTGTGFSSIMSSWMQQVPFIGYPRTRELDLNNDGIADWAKADYSAYPYVNFTPEARLGDGNGNWVQNSNLNPPISFITQLNGYDLSALILDLNGDGLPDLFRSKVWANNDRSADNGGYYLNTGNGWVSTSSSQDPSLWVSNDLYIPADVNGDGLIDFIGSDVNNSYAAVVYLHDGVVPDLLSRITYSQGGSTSVTYKATSQYLDNAGQLLNPNLPLKIQTVQSLTADDGFGNTSTTNYSYEGGKYYYSTAFDRKFAGFAKITKTDPQGNVIKTYYHQGDTTNSAMGEFNDNSSKIGKPYRIEIYDAAGNLYSKTINKWEGTDPDLPSSTNLVGYWNLNEGNGTTANDTSGNGNNGTLHNMDNSDWVTGKAGTGLDFDGTNDYVSIPHSASLNASNYLTVSAWVNPRVVSGGYIAEKQSSWHFQVANYAGVDGRLDLTLYKNGSSYDTISSSSIPANAWTFVAFTYSKDDSTHKPKLYINGTETTYALQQALPANYLVDTNANEINVGRYGSGVAYYNGIIDDTRIYSRILTPAEITALYNNPGILGGNGRGFLKLTQKIDSSYDGNASHKDEAETYVYDDTNGNLTGKTQWGEVTGSNDGTFTDAGNDKLATTISYASNPTLNVIGLPSQETTLDQNSNKVKESKYYYDTLALGSADKGNLTKEENWKSGTNYINAQKSYNSYGLVAQETDPRGKVTTYAYDSYNLYPVSVTNPLNQVTQYSYDYSSGKVKQTIDSNNFTFQTVYDGLDRAIEEKQPDLTTPSALVTKAAYVYTDTANAVSVKKTDYLDGTNSVDSYSYFDGLGRLIQTRKEAEGTNNFSVKDLIYNNRGLLNKESLPYNSTGTAKTTATSDSTLYSTYSYDPLERITSTVNAVGTVTNAYDDWKVTTTDAKGTPKDLYKDAYGNLIQVDEHNGGSTYTTTYNYDRAGNLTKITDALGNVRNFTYDGLGRRLTAEDLHTSSDATFGSWTYTYDNNSNLTSTLDPKNQTVNYTYDDLNRQLTEDYTGQAGTEVTYTYDTCVNGIGRLCSVVSVSETEAKNYNALGLISGETKTIDSVGYPASYTYDRQGNQTLITNPDSSQVKYEYNSAGLLEKVSTSEDSTPDPNFPSNNNLVGYWNLNEGTGTTANDTSGTGNNGTLMNMDNTNWVAGKAGTALNFAGTNDYVDIPHSTSLNISNYLTVGVWVNPSVASNAGYVIEKQSSWHFQIGGYAGVQNRLDLTLYQNGSAYDTISSPSIPTDTWTYVAFTYSKDDPTHKPKLYINGTETTYSLQQAMPSNYILYTTPNDVNIGRYGGGVAYFNGKIDDARIYSRVLTPAEVLALYNNPGGTGGSSGTFSDVVTNFDYSPMEQPTVISYVNGAATTNTYDATKLYRMTAKVTTIAGSSHAQDLAYTYDANGNITRIIDASATSTSKTGDYVYDPLNRLTSATITNVASGQSPYTENYAYDAIGNITSMNGQSYTYSQTGYANPHAVTSIGSTTFTYDNNGNLLTKGTSLTNTWDYGNRLTQTVSGSTTVTYDYDASGQRIKYSNGTTTSYYPSKYYNTDGTTDKKHIFANGIEVGVITGTGAGATVRYIHTDHLTGSNVITNSSNTADETLDYYPFGGIRIDSGSFNEQRKYGGHEYDSDTSLSYMNARYYDSGIGRFTNIDPLFQDIGINNDTFKQKYNRDLTEVLSDPQNLNSYSYVTNNPLIYTDPLGYDKYYNAAGQLAKDTDKGNNNYYEKDDIQRLNDNAALMSRNRGNYALFYDKVKTGGNWDFKNSDEVKKNGRENYFFSHQLVTPEQFGNLHYGYVGIAGGFSRGELVDVPGFVQNNPQLRNIMTNFDDPADTRKINQGMDYYFSSHINISTLASSTKQALYVTSNGPIYSRLAGLTWFTVKSIKNYFNK